jgi:hypothetical protein
MQSLQVRPGFLGSLNGGADIWVSEWKKAELLRSSPQLRGVCKGARRVFTINAGGRIGCRFALLFFFSVGSLNNVGSFVAHFEVSVPAKIARDKFDVTGYDSALFLFLQSFFSLENALTSSVLFRHFLS